MAPTAPWPIFLPRTKPQIAIDQVRQCLDKGIRVAAWTFDELCGRGDRDESKKLPSTVRRAAVEPVCRWQRVVEEAE